MTERQGAYTTDAEQAVADELYRYLTPAQVRQLCEYLRDAQETGYGEITMHVHHHQIFWRVSNEYPGGMLKKGKS